MNDFTIVAHPYIYLGFISLHYFAGQGLTGFLYWLRYGNNPLIYRKDKNRNLHSKISSMLSIPVIIWALSLCLYALSTSFRQTMLGQSLIDLNPVYGWLISLAGLIGMLFCQYQMGEAFRVGQELDEQSTQNTICRSGCFKYSRNPIYFFSMLYLIGTSLWVMILPVWISLCAILFIIHRLILTEEDFLTRRFGDTYLSYKRDVPRYWPI